MPLFNLVFFLGILAMPLVFWPWAKIPFEIPRVIFFERWVEVLAVLSILNLKHLKVKRIDLKLVVIVAIFIFVAFLASIKGFDFSKSLAGNYYRRDGLLTFFHFLGFSLFIFLFWKEKWQHLIAKAVSLGGMLSAIWVIGQAFKFFVLRQGGSSWYGSFGGTFGQPVFLAGFLLVALPFSLFLFRSSKRWQKIYLFTIAIQLMGIVLTRSLGAFLGVTLLFLVWLVLEKKKLKVLLLSLIIGVAVAGITGAYWWRSQHLGEVVDNPTVVVAEGRQRIFTKLILAFQKRPILGYGWANVDYAFSAVDWPVKFLHDVYVDKAHSHLLEVLVTTGLAGFLVYLVLLLYIFVRLVKAYLKNKNLWNICLLSVFLIFVFHSQTNIISISEEIIFWLIVGIIMAWE